MQYKAALQHLPEMRAEVWNQQAFELTTHVPYMVVHEYCSIDLDFEMIKEHLLSDAKRVGGNFWIIDLNILRCFLKMVSTVFKYYP